MLAPGLLLSIALPALAGLPWLLAAQSRRAPGGWPLAIAYGYVLGLLIVIAGMRALDFAHLPLNLFTEALLPVLVAAVGWWRLRGAREFARADARAARATWQSMHRVTRLVCAAALALIGLRLLTLGAEILLRPVFPWEAVSAVAAKARVWYALGELTPFVSPAAWLEGLGHFTDTEPAAFALPSLLLVWTAHAIGQWHEGAIGLPWWMLGLGLVLALYGHVRRAGGGVAFSLSAAYFFLSLPLVDLHIALAGAPQWIAAAGVGLAGCALLRWLEAPSRESLVCFAIGAALALLSMASTWAWFVIFALAIAMRRWPRFAGKLKIGVPLLTLFVLLAWLQFPLKMAGKALQLQVAGGWGETLESLFLLDNWHLLYGVALLVAIVGRRYLLSPLWLPRTWIIGMGLGLLFVCGVLAVPGIWYGGLRDLSYAALQFAPLLVLWIALAARVAAFPGQQQAVATPGLTA
jgi:hypothetical protein